MNNMPLVSCVMPTFGRPDYVAESIALFLAQDYPSKELIILNDCPGQIFHGDFPGVRIINAVTRWPSLGDKRNASIELANGDFIAVWDDDDIYTPWRLTHSIQRMQELATPLYCPAEYWAYWGDDCLQDNSAILSWIYHPIVIFRREIWQAVGGYPPLTGPEDTAFFTKVLRHLNIEWPRDPVAKYNRAMIMRGKSKYHHTSIPGGSRGPDTEARDIQLIPSPIEDPLLRSALERLIQHRNEVQIRRSNSRNNALNWPGIPSTAQRHWLDEDEPKLQQIGYGKLGRHGDLGYESRQVEINGEPFVHSLSAHAPSRLVYEIEGPMSHFCCWVAINDVVSPNFSEADFHVMGDGQLLGSVRGVRPRQGLREITIDIRGCRLLELVVDPVVATLCHSIWIDPFLVSAPSLGNG